MIFNAVPKPGLTPAIGDKLQDGSVFAGISPDTGQFICAMPADAAIPVLSWKHACDYAAALDALGRRGWRVPTLGELDILHRKRAVIGGFSITGWYWSSSSSSHGTVWVQRFSDGHQFSYSARTEGLLLRCVYLADPGVPLL